MAALLLRALAAPLRQDAITIIFFFFTMAPARGTVMQTSSQS
jgi:hypothetical protein